MYSESFVVLPTGGRSACFAANILKREEGIEDIEN